MTRKIKLRANHHHHHHQPYLVMRQLTEKLTNLWLSFPDRIGIWSVGLSLCVTLSMKDIRKNAPHH